MLGKLCHLTAQKQLATKSIFSGFFISQKRWNHIIKAQDAREVEVPLPHGNMAGN